MAFSHSNLYFNAKAKEREEKEKKKVERGEEDIVGITAACGFEMGKGTGLGCF